MLTGLTNQTKYSDFKEQKMNNKGKITTITIFVLVLYFGATAVYFALRYTRSKITEPQANAVLHDTGLTEPNLPAVTEQTEQEQKGLTENQQRLLKMGFPDLFVFKKPPPEKDPFQFRDRKLIERAREWKSLTGESDFQDFRFSMMHAPDYAKKGLESLFSGYRCFYIVTMRGVDITAWKTGTEEWEALKPMTGFDITYWFPDSNEPNDTVACTVEVINPFCIREVIKKMECRVRDILKRGLKKRCEFVENNPRYLELSQVCDDLLEDIGRTKITEYEKIKKTLGEPAVQESPRTYTISTGDKDIKVVYDGYAKIEAVSLGASIFAFDYDTMKKRIERIGARCLVDDIDVGQLLILHGILCQIDKHFDEQLASLRERL